MDPESLRDTETFTLLPTHSTRMIQTPRYQKFNSLHRLQQSDEGLPPDQDESDQGEPDQAAPGLYGKETDTDGFGIPMISSSKLHKLYRKALPKSLSTQPTQPLEYWTDLIRVKAIYAYRVDNPDSETFSFEADEVLIVPEVDGTWWPAMTKSGRQGLIPSNYFVLV